MQIALLTRRENRNLPQRMQWTYQRTAESKSERKKPQEVGLCESINIFSWENCGDREGVATEMGTCVLERGWYPPPGFQGARHLQHSAFDQKSPYWEKSEEGRAVLEPGGQGAEGQGRSGPLCGSFYRTHSVGPCCALTCIPSLAFLPLSWSDKTQPPGGRYPAPGTVRKRKGVWPWGYLVSPRPTWTWETKNVSIQGFPDGSVVKNLPASAGDRGLIPGSGSSYMPLGNPAWAPQP